MAKLRCWRCLKRTECRGKAVVLFIETYLSALPLAITLPQPLCKKCQNSFKKWLENKEHKGING